MESNPETNVSPVSDPPTLPIGFAVGEFFACSDLDATDAARKHTAGVPRVFGRKDRQY
jgi:hypothetical protein